MTRLNLALVAETLQAEHGRLGYRRSFLERHACGFQDEGSVLRNGDVLGEGTQAMPQYVSQDLITWPKLRHVLAYRFNPPRNVRSEDRAFRFQESTPREPDIDGASRQALPVRAVHRCGMNPYQHPVVFHKRLLDILELENVR